MANQSDLILSALRGEEPALLIADENCRDLPFSSLPNATRVLSNRIDITKLAMEAGLQSLFCDFDMNSVETPFPRRVVYHLSKEKPVVHHIVNQLAEVLAEGAELVIVGSKQQGIKTFAKTLSARLGGEGKLVKQGTDYVLTLRRGREMGAPLDDQLYRDLQPIIAIGDKSVVSKPGMFGWNKADRGSALLIDYFPEFLKTMEEPPATLLDLGCGYGFLSLSLATLGDYRITAVDNCAAAILACEENFRHHNINGEVIADDCGASLASTFDTVVCNPPFHQGFQNDRRLTLRFLSQTRKLLASGGKALFVVNQFVPLETLASNDFKYANVVATENGFKLVVLS